MKVRDRYISGPGYVSGEMAHLVKVEAVSG